MSNVRLIARLDVKGPNLIKGVHFEGLRVIGSPAIHALRYYQEGADELIYIDAVASLYGRNNLSDIVQSSAREIFIPMTVGGGIRSTDDVRHLLRCGADKVAVNTAAISRPNLITEIAREFGSQCMVLSIQAKQVSPGRWEAYTDTGRESSGLDVLEWAKNGVQLGAGEILLTSVDREGTRKGFDIDLVRAVSELVNVPVIASGGMGSAQHGVDVLQHGGADAIAMADILHHKRATIHEIRTHLGSVGIEVRHYEQ
jgi:cyclase